MIITIIGGGSTFTPGIVKSIALRKDELDVDEIRLYDLDQERQDKVAVVVRWILEEELKSGIKLTVTGYESESYIGPELAIQIENTSDRNVLVMSERLSVNGFMMEDALLTALVSADSVVDESIMFSRETFAQRGIKEIGKLEFHIEIFDTDTYDDIDKSDLLTLTLSEDYVVEVDYTGQELYNDNDIRIIYKGLDMDTSMNGLVYFLVENNSGKDISIWGRDVTINGIMDEDSFWIHARENTLAVGTLYLWEIGDYEIESVDQIETINLEFLVMEFDTMDDIASVPVNIEINPYPPNRTQKTFLRPVFYALHDRSDIQNDRTDKIYDNRKWMC
jgi:hypothetical protein